MSQNAQYLTFKRHLFLIRNELAGLFNLIWVPNNERNTTYSQVIFLSWIICPIYRSVCLTARWSITNWNKIPPGRTIKKILNYSQIIQSHWNFYRDEFYFALIFFNIYNFLCMYTIYTSFKRWYGIVVCGTTYRFKSLQFKSSSGHRTVLFFVFINNRVCWKN